MCDMRPRLAPSVPAELNVPAERRREFLRRAFAEAAEEFGDAIEMTRSRKAEAWVVVRLKVRDGEPDGYEVQPAHRKGA
jgi:hypothetical protein